MATIQDLVNALSDGQNNAIHASDLEDELNMDKGHTQEPTRDLIREAIIGQDIPVGSTPRDGYFLINSENELEAAVSDLEARIQGLHRRIESIQRGWNRRVQSRNSGNNWPK